MKINFLNLKKNSAQITDVFTELLAKAIDSNVLNSISLNLNSIVESYVKDNKIEAPRILITQEAQLKMTSLVAKCEMEVGWYGTVTELEPNIFVIDDILVYPQTVSAAYCEQDEDMMWQFEYNLSDDQVNRRRMHGHSHVNMGVTPSVTDETHYQTLVSQVKDYHIMLIVNKRGDCYTRFYDVVNNLIYTDLEVELYLPDFDLKEWLEQATSIVKPKAPQYTRYANGQQMHYGIDDNYMYDIEYTWDPKTGRYIVAQKPDRLVPLNKPTQTKIKTSTKQKGNKKKKVPKNG